VILPACGSTDVRVERGFLRETVFMHVPEDELSRYVIAQLAENRTREVDSHLGACAACVETLAGKAESLARVSKGIFERLELERQSGAQGSLQPLNPFSSQRCEAWLIDVSRSGIKVMVCVEIDPRTLVQVRFHELVLIGRVRSYDFADGSYYLSLKITGAAL
jgi:hypothetical protein